MYKNRFLQEHVLEENTGPAPSGQVRFTFLGTNSLYIQDGQTRILIDPNFTRPAMLKWPGKLHSSREKISKSLQKAGIQNLDAILLTHTHLDHALDAVETARLSGATLIGSDSAGNIALGAGLPSSRFQIVSAGDEYRNGDFKIRFLKGTHMPWLNFLGEHVLLGGRIKKPLKPPASVFSYQAGQVLHFFIQHPQGNLLCVGSAGGFDKTMDGVRADVTALCIGGLGIKSNAYINNYFHHYARRTGAKKTLLTHWDIFSRDMNRPLKLIPGTRRCFYKFEKLGGSEPKIRIVFPPVGEEISLFKGI